MARAGGGGVGAGTASGDVVRIGGSASLPVRALPEPELSPGLAVRMRLVAEHGGKYAGNAPAQELAEAGRVLARYDALCVPTVPDHEAADRRDVARGQSLIVEWMELVALGVVNAPDKPLRMLRAAMVFDTSGDLPVACWTHRTRAGFAKRGSEGKFWPSDTDVDAFLRPIGDALLSRRDALRAIRDAARALAASAEPVSVKPESQAERDAIVAKFQRDWQAMQADRLATEQEAAADGKLGAWDRAVAKVRERREQWLREQEGSKGDEE